MNFRLIFLALIVLLIGNFQLLAQTNEHNIKIYHKSSDNGAYTFFADNSNHVPYTIQLTISELKNLKSDIDLPLKTVIPAGVKNFELLSLTPIDGRTTSFASSSTMFIGDFINAKPDTTYKYILPFAHGKTHKIDQGFGGSFSHLSTNYYAVDFDLNIGDSVFAARDGLVVDLKEDSDKGGSDPSFSSAGNFLTILHSDGSLSQYVHLKQNGVLPKRGDSVKTAEHIGYSGATGWADGPHLHFMVLKPTDDGPVSIPILFKGYENEALVPVEDRQYLSVHPGKTLVQIDPDINNNKANTRTLNPIDQVEIRMGEFYVTTVKQDDKIIIVAVNGLEETVTSILNISGNNFVSSKDLPYTITTKGISVHEVLTLIEKEKGKGLTFNVQYSITK